MRQAGRKSATKLSIVALPGQRAEPPKYLSKPQAAIWRAVVATKPASWFTADSHPLLIAYCRHSVSADLLSQQIDAIEAGNADPSELKTLLTMRAQETASLVKLATSMRISQHARLKAETAATQADNAGDALKPWE